MATIVVRDLDDDVKVELVALAAAHGRSMEAEVRVIIGEAVRRRARNLGVAAYERFRQVGGADDLSIPERSGSARAASFDE